MGVVSKEYRDKAGVTARADRVEKFLRRPGWRFDAGSHGVDLAHEGSRICFDLTTAGIVSD
jgi:hypothetical protein